MRVHGVIVMVAALLLPALCSAGVREDLQGVKKQIREKNLLLNRTQKVETKVTGELQQIGRSLAEKQASLAALGRDLAAVEQASNKTLQDIAREEAETEKKRQQINRRIAAVYKSGDTGNLRVFFSSESFPQMTENLRYMRSVLQNDKKLFAQYNQNLAHLKELKGRLEQDAARKEAIRRSIEAKKREIEQEKSRKSNYLVKVRQDKQGYVASIKDLQANARRLEVMFAQLEARKRKAALEARRRALEARKALEARNRKAYSSKSRGRAKETQQAALPPMPQVPDRGLGGQKGRLSMPVRGAIVDRFGRHKNQYNSFTFSNGISVAAPAGTPIHAVYDGEVIYANYFKGYGNMVIVDHGGGFFSLYAHASSVSKRVGAKVARNEVLGSVGDVDSPKGPGLYFEIRYQGKPVDPAPWFR